MLRPNPRGLRTLPFTKPVLLSRLVFLRRYSLLVLSKKQQGSNRDFRVASRVQLPSAGW
jgi:hypothetical protein